MKTAIIMIQTSAHMIPMYNYIELTCELRCTMQDHPTTHGFLLMIGLMGAHCEGDRCYCTAIGLHRGPSGALGLAGSPVEWAPNNFREVCFNVRLLQCHQRRTIRPSTVAHWVVVGCLSLRPVIFGWPKGHGSYKRTEAIIQPFF